MEVFKEWPQLLDQYLNTHEDHEEIQIPGESPRTIALVISPLYNRFNVLEECAIPYEDMRFMTTFSAGVATFPDHSLTGDGILQAADKALYQSNNYGRNRVTMSARS